MSEDNKKIVYLGSELGAAGSSIKKYITPVVPDDGVLLAVEPTEEKDEKDEVDNDE